jgi:hypothetical protein
LIGPPSNEVLEKCPSTQDGDLDYAAFHLHQGLYWGRSEYETWNPALESPEEVEGVAQEEVEPSATVEDA